MALTPTVTTNSSGMRSYNGVPESLWKTLTPTNQQFYLQSGAGSLNQIGAVVNSSVLPSSLNAQLDALRNPQPPTPAQISEAQHGIVAGPVYTPQQAVTNLNTQYQQNVQNAAKLASGTAFAAPTQRLTGSQGSIVLGPGSTGSNPAANTMPAPVVGLPGTQGAAGMLNASQYGYAPAQMSAAGQTYNPVTRSVSPQELASEQLRQIVDQRSPLMQQAETAGKQTAARRGLLNSSIAAGAAQGEVLRAATPLAQQNAQTVSGVLTGNQNVQNQAAQFNATAAFNREAGNVEAQNAAKVFGATQLADMNKLVTEYGLKNAQLQIAADIQKDQEAFSQGNTLQRTYVDQTNQLMGNYLNGWFRIQESQMTPEEKAAALGEYNATVRTYQNVLNTAFASLPAWSDEWGATLMTG